MRNNARVWIGLALATASQAACTSNRLATMGNGVTLPSLYGNFQEERASHATRGDSRSNPCHFRGSGAEDTQVAFGQEVGFRHGAFREWCRAALAAELEFGNTLIERLTGTETANTYKPSDWEGAAGFANQRYLDAGIALSNQLCEGYFQRMGLSDAALTFSDTLVSDLGTASSGVQSLTGVAQSTIGVTSAALGLFGSTVRNSRQNFAFDGNIDSVYFLVRNHRANHLASLRASQNQPNSFWHIYDWLNSYHASCSYMAIRVMVDEAITQRAAAASSNTPSAVPTLDESNRAALSERLGLKTVLSDFDIVQAVALTGGDRTPAQLRDTPGFVDTPLDRLEGEATTLTGLFAQPEARTALTSALLQNGLGTYGAYLARARRALTARSFAEGATPTQEASQRETQVTDSPLPPTQQSAPR